MRSPDDEQGQVAYGMKTPSKTEVFQRIRDQLADQLAAAEKAAGQARDSFQVGDDRAENRGERGAIQEKSWLLSAHAGRVEELQQQLHAAEKTELKTHDAVVPGALVYLEEEGGGEPEVYLLHPDLGGVEVQLEEYTIFVISPAAPLGAALMGKKVGDLVELQLPGGTRRLKITAVE
jgi:transcription elongation GreA/GreB family factor